jgi:hypothetical protein
MSFRRFMYYSTLVGAWAAFVGWALARVVAPSGDVLSAAIYGLAVGLLVAFGLSLVEALWNFSPSQFLAIFGRVTVATFIGLVGSSACGGLAGYLFSIGNWSVLFLLSWIVLGLLIGLAVSAFDVVAGLARKDLRGPLTKLIKCSLGGTAGGVLGGVFAWLLKFPVGNLLGDPGGNNLWTPTAVGFVILGGLIGLLVGLSQVVLLEAWIRVEAGFRSGRDVVLSRERTLIGRAEGSDIALFGDHGVEKRHALIHLERGGYFLEPLPNTSGTYINDQPVLSRTRLVAGDLIRVGKSVLRFNQRRKR